MQISALVRLWKGGGEENECCLYKSGKTRSDSRCFLLWLFSPAGLLLGVRFSCRLRLILLDYFFFLLSDLLITFFHWLTWLLLALPVRIDNLVPVITDTDTLPLLWSPDPLPPCLLAVQIRSGNLADCITVCWSLMVVGAMLTDLNATCLSISTRRGSTMVVCYINLDEQIAQQHMDSANSPHTRLLPLNSGPLGIDFLSLQTHNSAGFLPMPNPAP